MGLMSILGGGSKNSSSSQSTSSSDSLSKGSSSSWNQAYPALQAFFDTGRGNADRSTTQIGNLLGLNGPQDQAAANDIFRSTPGYNFLMDEALRGVTGGAAGMGNYFSGATMKALQDRAMGVADQSYNQYFSNLLGQQGYGTTLAQLLSGAGGRSEAENMSTSHAESQSTSQSKGKATGGLGDFIGKVGSVFMGGGK